MLTAAARDDVDRQDLDPYVRDRQTRRPPDRVERLRSRMLRMALYRHTQTGALPHGVGRTKNDAGRLVLRTIEQAVRRSSEKAGTSIPEPCSHDLYVSVPVHSVLMRSISRSCKREGWDRTTNSARIGHLTDAAAWFSEKSHAHVASPDDRPTAIPGLPKASTGGSRR